MANAPNNPLWAIARLLVTSAGLTGTLWTNASDFDATELRTIVVYVLLSAGAEGLSLWYGRPNGTEDTDENHHLRGGIR